MRLEDRSIKSVFHTVRRKLAKAWLDINSQLIIIGVTGSFGKTNTVRAISEVVSSEYPVNQTDLNLDTVYNLPVTILRTKPWDEILVLEYGVDHRNEMDFHLSLVKPKIAVLTGITPVHADDEHLGSLENIIKEKSKLINSLPSDGLAVFNADDEEVKKIGEGFEGKKIFYGTQKSADIWADEIKITLSGTEFQIHDGKELFLLKTGLLGYPAVYSSLAAYAVAKHFQIEKEKILKRMAKLTPLAGRLSLEKGPLGTILVNDSLRANPASTLAGLRSLAEFPGRKIAVLGEMGEMGDWEERMHRVIGQNLANLNIDMVVGVGPLTRLIIEEAKNNGMKNNQLFWAKNVREASVILKKILKKDDLLYLKASLLRHLERIILLLEGKPVGCTAVVCHRYQPCTSCSQLAKCLQ